ncbi:MAG: class I SAM-dependent methyltransferase [Anaerolineae bacterium]|nr:class I SAM-dependent methyltransferase [Anaerolineae bacterium]
MMHTSLHTCPHCGQTPISTKFQNQDYISGETFDIKQCLACGVAWTALPITNFDLSYYYGPSYYGKQGKRFPALVEALVREFRLRRMRELLPFFEQPGRALDIGCGRALMLAALKERGWQCVGTEFDAELAKAAKNQYDIDVFTQPTLAECKFPAAHFDLITLYHVFEHVSDPFATLAEIKRILKPGGICLIEVPNLSSWQAQMSQGHWFHLDTPRHLWHFSRETLTQLMQEYGLSPLKNSTHSPEYGYYGFWQSMLNRISGEMNLAYRLIKRAPPAPNHRTSAAAMFINALLFIPAAIIALPAEALATLMGKGCIIKIIARKEN